MDADRPARPVIGLPAPALAGLCACAVVATGAWLGAGWLRASVLWMPVGLWIVGVAIGWAWLGRAPDVRLPGHDLLRTPVPTGRLGAAARRLADGFASAGTPAWFRWTLRRVLCPALGRLADVAGDAALLAGVPRERLETAGRRLAAWHDTLAWPEAPLRVGVDMPSEQMLSLTSRSGLSGVEWVRVDAGTDDEADCARYDLDAIVRQPPAGPARVATRAEGGLEPGWYDWTSPRPLTYASVFPGRVDPEIVTLDGVDWQDTRHAALAGRIVEAAALLSRLPGRLTLSARLRGRRPVTLHPARPEAAIAALAETLNWASGRPGPLVRAVARAVGAHATSDAAHLDTETRARLAQASAAHLPDEPEAALRLAAARFAMLDDESAFEQLRRADRMLRERPAAGEADHLAFLQSEVELGLPGPLTLGRVASGICLVCASCSPEQFELVREDILDDLRFSGWLIGRDHDRAVLIEVFRRLGPKPRERDLPAAA